MTKSINIVGTIALVVITVAGFYFSNFSGASLLLGIGIIIVWAVSEYLLKSNAGLDSSNIVLNRENKSLEDKIKILSEKISTISIVANQGSPYKILVLSKSDIHKNKEYVVEVIISTIYKQCDIKYLNISYNERIVFNSDNMKFYGNMYKITSNFPKLRNGRYEYGFELTDDFSDRICAKCVFKFKYELDKELNMNIEISSDNGINKIEIFNYQLI